MPKALNIALLSAAVSNKSGSRAPLDLAVYLSRLGHNVSFFAFNAPFEKEAEDYLLENKVKVSVLGSPTLLGRWQAAFKLFGELRRLNPDLVSTHCTFPFSFAAWISRKPVVKTYYGLQFFSWNALSGREKLISGFLDRIIIWREKITFLMANKVVAISKYLSQEAEEMLGKKAEYIYIGVSKSSKFSTQGGPALGGKVQSSKKIQNSNFKEKGEVLVLSVSRIVPYKGFDILIEALKKIDLPWKLVIVGGYSKEEYFEKIKTLADERIVFLKGISDADLSALYDLCDLYSLGGNVWEGFGMPFLEAGLRSKPSVAFKHTALPEVIAHNETGLLAQSEEEFATYLKKLIQDKNLREQMGKDAKIHAQKFTWERCAKEYERLFTDLIGK